jgi:hypothetical protein
METVSFKQNFKTQLVQQLHSPGRLRALVTGLMLLIGYVAIYMPLSNEIAATTEELATEQRRLELARRIERLQVQCRGFEPRLRDKHDPNEWVQYVLTGIRGLPLKLTTLDSDPPRLMGPYQAVVLRIELEGTFRDLSAFVRWLETNERLFRVDAVKIAPHRTGQGVLVMQLTVLGVMG